MIEVILKLISRLNAKIITEHWILAESEIFYGNVFYLYGDVFEVIEVYKVFNRLIFVCCIK